MPSFHMRPSSLKTTILGPWKQVPRHDPWDPDTVRAEAGRGTGLLREVFEDVAIGLLAERAAKADPFPDIEPLRPSTSPADVGRLPNDPSNFATLLPPERLHPSRVPHYATPRCSKDKASESTVRWEPLAQQLPFRAVGTRSCVLGWGGHARIILFGGHDVADSASLCGLTVLECQTPHTPSEVADGDRVDVRPDVSTRVEPAGGDEVATPRVGHAAGALSEYPCTLYPVPCTRH